MGKIYRLRLVGTVMMRRSGNSWLFMSYVGGIVVSYEADHDELSLMNLLDYAVKCGYKKVGNIYYRIPCKQQTLNLKSINDDSSVQNMLKLLDVFDSVDIYYDSSDRVHPLLGLEEPSVVCKKLGINEHGEKVGDTNGSEGRVQARYDTVEMSRVKEYSVDK